MFDNSNLIVTAWDNELFVGVSRSITDWVWACYLSDLAVRHDYKKEGIGKQLINLTKEKIGNQSMVLLLSFPTASIGTRLIANSSCNLSIRRTIK